MKKERKPQRNTHSSFRPGTLGYSIVLGFLLFMSVYTLFMVLAIYDSNPEVSLGFLLSQCIWIIIAVTMLFFQIRYWIRTQSGPDLKEMAASFAGWFLNFLFPVKRFFHPLGEAASPPAQMTARFRESLSLFYSEKKAPEQVTQFYGNLLRLHRNRLDRLELGVRLSPGSPMHIKGMKDMTTARIPDGRLSHDSITEHLKAERSLLSGSRTVYRVRGNVTSVCDFVGAEKGSGDSKNIKILCPNCGSAAAMSELIRGCPYCDTAFLMENLKKRVCSFSLAPNPEADEILFCLHLDQIINRVTFIFLVLEAVLGFGSMFLDVFIKAGASLKELPIAVFLSVSSLLLLFFMALVFSFIITVPIRAAAHYIYRKRREKGSLDHQVMVRNQQMLKKACETDRDFSMESFFSNVRNKIAAIHYSTEKGQADVFSRTDLSDAIESYKDVADIAWGPVELLDYETGEVYRKARVAAWLKLLRWDGQKITESGEKIILELKKASKESRENPYGIHVPTCSRCGASVDLLKGNRCAHCGSDLNFINLDWCITEYSSERA